MLATVLTLGTLVVVPVVLVVVFSRVFFGVLPMVRVRVRVVRVVMMVRVVRVVERRLFQRPSKRTTEEIGDFKGLYQNTIHESVMSPARVVLSSSVFLAKLAAWGTGSHSTEPAWLGTRCPKRRCLKAGLLTLGVLVIRRAGMGTAPACTVSRGIVHVSRQSGHRRRWNVRRPVLPAMMVTSAESFMLGKEFCCYGEKFTRY